MLSLAVRGWLVSVGLGVLAVLVTVFLAGMLAGAWTPRGNHAAIPFAIIAPIGAGLLSLSQFLTGRWVARRAPGRELSACLAFVMLQALLATIATFGPRSLENSWFPLTYPFCFLGALTVRRRVLAKS